MEILHDMLFSGSGVVYDLLYEEELLSQGLSYSYSRTGPLAMHVLAGEADDPDRVYDRLRGELLRRQALLDTDPERAISRADFDRCKRVAYAEYVKAFDSTEEIAGNLLSFAMEGYDLFAYAELLASVRYEDVCAALRNFWEDERVSLSVILPLRDRPVAGNEPPRAI